MNPINYIESNVGNYNVKLSLYDNYIKCNIFDIVSSKN